jgi:hypothetical protein
VSTVCATGQIFDLDRGCQQCPAFCSVCIKENGAYFCTQCQSSQYTPTAAGTCAFNAQSCTSGQTAVLSASSQYGYCANCPQNCAACTVTNTMSTQQFACTACVNSSFTLSAQNYCVPSAIPAGSYYG